VSALIKKKSRKKQLIFLLLINNDWYIDVFNTCLLHNTFILRRRENKCYFDILSREKVYIFINTYSIVQIKSSNKIDKKKLVFEESEKERECNTSSQLAFLGNCLMKWYMHGWQAKITTFRLSGSISKYQQWI